MATPSTTDKLLRLALTLGHGLLRASWFVRRPRTYGAHALALTEDRKVILVKLRYAPGWRLPGGGRGADEPAEQAVLRELREEIGMTAHGRVTHACTLDENTDFKRDLASLLIVEDVRFAPRRFSWEIEQVMAAPIGALPSNLSPRARRWLDALRTHL
ncbi:MAG: NUDIX domain-containing protein [Sphingomicrobium sp.]